MFENEYIIEEVRGGHFMNREHPESAGEQSACGASVSGMGESKGGVAGFDDLSGERQPVDNRRAWARVGA